MNIYVPWWMTYHEAATCDMSGLSIGYGYWLVGNG